MKKFYLFLLFVFGVSWCHENSLIFADDFKIDYEHFVIINQKTKTFSGINSFSQFHKDLLTKTTELFSAPNSCKYLTKTQQDTNNKNNRVHKALLRGTLGSISFGFMGILIGGRIKSERFGSRDVYSYSENTDNAIIGGVLGSCTGSLLGVYLGRENKKKGTFSKTLTGSILCGAAAYLLVEKTGGLSIFFLPPIGATIGLML